MKDIIKDIKEQVKSLNAAIKKREEYADGLEFNAELAREEVDEMRKNIEQLVLAIKKLKS